MVMQKLYIKKQLKKRILNNNHYVLKWKEKEERRKIEKSLISSYSNPLFLALANILYLPN